MNCARCAHTADKHAVTMGCRGDDSTGCGCGGFYFPEPEVVINWRQRALAAEARGLEMMTQIGALVARAEAAEARLAVDHWIPTAVRKPLEGQIVCAHWTFQGKYWYEVALYHSGGKFSPWSDELDCYDPECTIPYPSHWCELRPGTTVRP